MYKILKKEIINSTMEKMVVEAPYVSRNCLAGQFVMIRVDENGERVPLTIADYNREEKSVTIFYQIVGYTTKKLSEKRAGDFLTDFAGPLGQPAKFGDIKNVLGIGGGVGAAPLYPQLKMLKEKGISVDVIIGGRNSEFILLEKEFREIADNIYITTDDGSKGEKGFVTNVLTKLLENSKKYDEVIAIGPVMMMKNVVSITREFNIKTSVSLNPIMIDGTGMCGGCRVSINGETKFACVDGPDFDGFSVDFDLLMKRQTMYKEEESECKIGRG